MFRRIPPFRLLVNISLSILFYFPFSAVNAMNRCHLIDRALDYDGDIVLAKVAAFFEEGGFRWKTNKIFSDQVYANRYSLNRNKREYGNAVVAFAKEIGCEQRYVDEIIQSVRSRNISEEKAFNELAALIARELEGNPKTTAEAYFREIKNNPKFAALLPKLNWKSGQIKKYHLSWNGEWGSATSRDAKFIFINPFIAAFKEQGYFEFLTVFWHEATHANHAIRLEYLPFISREEFTKLNLKNYMIDEGMAIFEELGFRKACANVGIIAKDGPEVQALSTIVEQARAQVSDRSNQKLLFLEIGRLISEVKDPSAGTYLQHWENLLFYEWGEQTEAFLYKHALKTLATGPLPVPVATETILNILDQKDLDRDIAERVKARLRITFEQRNKIFADPSDRDALVRLNEAVMYWSW